MKRMVACTALCAVLLAAEGCRTDEELTPGKERTGMTFTSTADQIQIKTTLHDDMRVTWSSSDRISVFDGTYNNVFSLKDGAGDTSATFEGAAIPDVSYTALYPYSEKAEYIGNKICSELPSEQFSSPAEAGTFSSMLNPAIAIAPSGNTLEFKNVAGLIKVAVTNLPDGMKVKSINVRADQSLSGPYTVDTSADVLKAVPSDDAKLYDLNLTGREGVLLENEAYYLVALPGDYTEMMVTIIISDIEGKNLKHIRMTATENISVPVNGGVELTADASKAIDGLPETDIYQDFLDQNINNILLDFSYAGYMHGEAEPPAVNLPANPENLSKAEVNGIEYTIYNITAYGGIPDDNISDREAFIKILTEITGGETNPEGKANPLLNATGDQLTFYDTPAANAIVYFPEGEFILHTEEDNVANAKAPEGAYSTSMIIRCGNFILKGAGRDKTKIIMQDPNLPSSDNMYSSPDMIQLKHNTGVQSSTILATVTGNSEKGSFSVTASGIANIKAGDWVCLYLKNSSQDVVEAELEPYEADQSWTIASADGGVSVQDLHQVASVSGNTITFKEPIMHDIDASWNWTVVRYQHYENVGVEDLTFTGYAKEDFKHHGSWEDDGAYKPLSMTRLTNSWIRRVNFESVSEACSIIISANVSAYDCHITGNRGHAAIRSQGSSRVFIGACTDKSTNNGAEAGQYHSFGISKESMGAVLWRNYWGPDSNFESHASQPRASLFDCCTGGWMTSRAGGNANELPNHLDDLTIWNFNATASNVSGTWKWWADGNVCKFLPPVIAGFHGTSVEFDQSQVKADVSHGTPVSPESLNEAQLQNRLGSVPGWLAGLKGTAEAN